MQQAMGDRRINNQDHGPHPRLESRSRDSCLRGVQEGKVTYIYRAFGMWSEKPQALVKCDKCGKTNGIDILPGTTVQHNRVELETRLLQCGWDVELTDDEHCLCSQHKEEK